MKPSDRPTVFRESRRLLQRFIQEWYVRDRSSLDGVGLGEARLRLEQLDYLLEHIGELERQQMPLGESNLPMLVQLHAECFYYIAGRFRTLVQKNKGLRLSAFECVAIRDVRNRLIEHQEKSNGFPLVSIGWRFEDGRGPVLEGRRGMETIPDEGLFRNAEKMRVAVESTLHAAIAKMADEPLGEKAE